MRLLLLHKVLILAAVALAAFYAGRELVLGAEGCGPRAIVALVAGGILAGYYLLILRGTKTQP